MGEDCLAQEPGDRPSRRRALAAQVIGNVDDLAPVRERSCIQPQVFLGGDGSVCSMPYRPAAWLARSRSSIRGLRRPAVRGWPADRRQGPRSLQPHLLSVRQLDHGGFPDAVENREELGFLGDRLRREVCYPYPGDLPGRAQLGELAAARRLARGRWRSGHRA